MPEKPRTLPVDKGDHETHQTIHFLKEDRTLRPDGFHFEAESGAIGTSALKAVNDFKTK